MRRLLLAACLLASSRALAAADSVTLMWDRNTEPNVTGYRVFVGTQSGVYTETFDVPAATPVFVYRNASTGSRYYFAVAAQADKSVFGPKSQEVSTAGTTTVGGGGVPDDDRRTAVPRGGTAECGPTCFVVTEVAAGLGAISSLAVSPDGSLFAVEAGERVLMTRGGVVTAVMIAPAGTRLLEMALDRDFAATGRVFVLQVRARDGSTGELEILRQRYLEGTLAESAAVVAGLAIPLGASASFAQGSDGLLYVALPATARRDPYSSSVLVFDQDGHVPDGQPAGSPVIARGFDQPSALAWDTRSQGLWLVGRDQGAPADMISLMRGSGSRVPSLPSDISREDGVTAVAVASGSSRRLLLAAGQDLVEVTPGLADSLRISLEGYGSPVAIAAAPTGERYVAVRKDMPSGATYSLLKVEETRTRLPR